MNRKTDKTDCYTLPAATRKTDFLLLANFLPQHQYFHHIFVKIPFLFLNNRIQFKMVQSDTYEQLISSSSKYSMFL